MRGPPSLDTWGLSSGRIKLSKIYKKKLIWGILLKLSEEKIFKGLKSVVINTIEFYQCFFRGEWILIRMMKSASVRRAFLIGCLLHMFQQLAGINTGKNSRISIYVHSCQIWFLDDQNSVLYTL